MSKFVKIPTVYGEVKLLNIDHIVYIYFDKNDRNEDYVFMRTTVYGASMVEMPREWYDKYLKSIIEGE